MKKLPRYQIKQYFLSAKSKKDFAKNVFAMKCSMAYGDYGDAIGELIKLSPRFRQLFFGTQFPSNLAELGCCNPYFYKSPECEVEIKWLIYQIRKNRNSIADFVNIQNEVDRLFMLGRYGHALERVEQTVKKFGYSMWYIEMKILIYHAQGKLDDVLKFSTEVNKCQKEAKSGFVSYLTYLYGKRSNPQISAYDFDEELADNSKRSNNSFQVDRYYYFLFRTNYYDCLDLDDYSSVLVMESTNSLIDRYIILIKVLKALFVGGGSGQKHEMSKYADILYKLTYDKSLLPLIVYTRDVPDEYYESSLVEILDAYYAGHYESCLSSAKSYLNTHPNNVDVIKLYCRSLLFLKKKYTCICSDDSPVDKISKLIYLLMSGKDVEKNKYQIYQLFKNFNNLSIADGLYCYIKEKHKKEYKKQYKSIVSLIYDPNGARMYENQDEQVAFINKGIMHFPNNHVLYYQKKRYENEISQDKSIVPYIREIGNARILFEKGGYDECINVLEGVRVTYPNHIPIQQNVVKLTFDSYVHKNDLQQAISYYVKNRINESATIEKIDTKEISEILHRRKYKGVKYTIDYLLFMLCSDQSDTARGAVLERYCEYKDICSLADLLSVLPEKESEKVELFVYLLVKSDVLRHTQLVGSTKQIIEINSLLVQGILEREPIHSDEFKELNEELAAEMIVYTGMRKVDDSLIYANVPAILKYELSEAKPLYEQFRAHYDLSDKCTYYVVYSTLAGEAKRGELMTQQVRFTDTSLYDTSYQLFESIMLPFLRSKFGVGTYLSTRIRHGVFETDLQSVFIEQHLMLQMENNKYVPDMYWSNRYGLDFNEKEKLFVQLAQLSLKVNSIIFSFKEDVLQIRTSDEEKGSFDYRLTSDEICMAVINAYCKTDNFEAFCMHLINHLWEITNKSLLNIRKMIDEPFKKEFHQVIDAFQKETSLIGNEDMQRDFATAIANVRSGVNSHLHKIERWFYIQDCKFDDFVFGSQLQIVWNLICKTHPSVKCELKFNKDELPQNVISGEYCIHICDLLHIFFANMLKHSKKEYIRHFEMKTSVVKDYLYLHFENEFEGDEIRVNNNILTLLNSYEKLQKEGGSGLVKARKIVKYDLGDIDNEVDVKVVEGKCYTKVKINLQRICAKKEYLS